MKRLFMLAAAVLILGAVCSETAPLDTEAQPSAYHVQMPSKEKISRCIRTIEDAISELAADFSIEQIPQRDPAAGDSYTVSFSRE